MVKLKVDLLPCNKVFLWKWLLLHNRFHSILHTWIWMSKYDVIKTTISQLTSCPFWLRFYRGLRNCFSFIRYLSFTFSNFYLDFSYPFSNWTFSSLFHLDFYFPFLFRLLFPFFPFFQFHRGQSSWISSKFFFNPLIFSLTRETDTR